MYKRQDDDDAKAVEDERVRVLKRLCMFMFINHNEGKVITLCDAKLVLSSACFTKLSL